MTLSPAHTAQCLEKIETLVTGKEPRNVPIMAPYFAYWERRMFEALTKMIVAGVRAVHQVERATRALKAFSHQHASPKTPLNQ